MRKSIFVIILMAVTCIMASCGQKTVADEPVTGALTMPDYTSEIRGRIARFQNGCVMLVTESNGPIVLGGDMNFDGLNNGDDITIYCDAVCETWPAQAIVKEMVLHSRGSEADVPKETIENLQALGYVLDAATLSEPCPEQTEEPGTVPEPVEEHIDKLKDGDLVECGTYAFQANYIRTDGYDSARCYPGFQVISSLEELEDYVAGNSGSYSFESFKTAIAGYDAAWFADHKLLLVLMEEGSGSVRHEVISLSNEEVSVKRKVPDVGTCDMAEWHIIIEVDASFEPTEDFKVITL